MTWHVYVRILAAAVIAATSAVAQTSQSVPEGASNLPRIRFDQAEQHLIERKPPTYPPLAKAAKIEGDVRLTLRVDPNGEVVDAFPLTGHPLLVFAAIDLLSSTVIAPSN